MKSFLWRLRVNPKKVMVVSRVKRTDAVVVIFVEIRFVPNCICSLCDEIHVIDARISTLSGMWFP